MQGSYPLKEIRTYIETLAPPERAEEWDRVGLMIGSDSDWVTGIVLSLDVTSEGMDLCTKTGANLMITHHPIFFEPCFSIVTDMPSGKRIARLIEEKISVYSAHTNLDRADYGVNQALCDAIHFDSSLCSPKNDYALYVTASSGTGLIEFAQRSANRLGSSGILLNTNKDREIHNICLCAGSFDERLIPSLIRDHIDTVLTGEIKHHISLLLDEAGIACIALGHEATERVVLPYLGKKLSEVFPDIPVNIVRGNVFTNRI